MPSEIYRKIYQLRRVFGFSGQSDPAFGLVEPTNTRHTRSESMQASTARHVFVAGGTGYIGRRAIDALLARGHRVRALVRAGSERTLPAACEIVTGDALDARTFATSVAPCDTFVELVGTPKPSPSKAAEFERVD